MKAAFRHLVAALFERQVRRVIRRHNLRVVAVAGSVGKTSTKLAIATVLKQKYRTLVHQGNYNSEVGLPLSVFELEVPRVLINPFAWAWLLLRSERKLRSYPYQVLVLELGTDHPGEIAAYLRYLRPDIGVITAVAPEHMENFTDLDHVAAEELTLVSGSKQLVANRDDIAPKYRREYIDHHPDHHYYGLGKDKELAGGFEIAVTDPVAGTSGTLISHGKAVDKDLHLQVYGGHAVKSALAAYVVGEFMDLSAAQLSDGLAHIHPVAGRMNPLAGLNGATIIDDTYNSSPEAVEAALDALAAAPVTGRRIAILGSMNELGAESPRYHREIGAAAARLDMLVTVGKLANEYLGPAATAAGLDPANYRPAASPVAAADHLSLILRPGDVLLVKGSQNGVFAEEAVKPLLANPADAKHLVRQSPAWLKIKAKQFPDIPYIRT